MNELKVLVEIMPEDVSSVVVKIFGPVNIVNVNVLLMQLLYASNHSDNLLIDLAGVTEIDVAGLQLFCSSHRSSIFNKKGFKITGQNQTVIWEKAFEAGQLRSSGCVIDTQNSCIWSAINNDENVNPGGPVAFDNQLYNDNFAHC